MLDKGEFQLTVAERKKKTEEKQNQACFPPPWMLAPLLYMAATVPFPPTSVPLNTGIAHHLGISNGCVVAQTFTIVVLVRRL